MKSAKRSQGVTRYRGVTTPTVTPSSLSDTQESPNVTALPLVNRTPSFHSSIQNNPVVGRVEEYKKWGFFNPQTMTKSELETGLNAARADWDRNLLADYRVVLGDWILESESILEVRKDVMNNPELMVNEGDWISTEGLEVHVHGVFRVHCLLDLRKKYVNGFPTVMNGNVLNRLLHDYQYAQGLKLPELRLELRAQFGVKRLEQLPVRQYKACGEWLTERLQAALENPGKPPRWNDLGELVDVTVEAWERLAAGVCPVQTA